MPIRPLVESAVPSRSRTAVPPCVARLTAVLALLAVPALVQAAGVSVRFDFANPDTAPFPSNYYTQVDTRNNTSLRVALPLPDCNVRPSDCADVAVLNTMDGFNTQPRISIPFTGDIDPSTVSSKSVFLVSLGDALTGKGAGRKVGINQVAWDAEHKTLVVESDDLLKEHTHYVLVVTDRVRDSAGDRIEVGSYGQLRDGKLRHPRAAALVQGLQEAERQTGIPAKRIVALSPFTTQSISADLLKIRAQIQAATPAPVNFMIGNGGATRAAFPVADVQFIQWQRQTGTAPTYTSSYVPTPALQVFPGAVASVAFGQFNSPDYETAAKVIPTTGTRTGTPVPQGSNPLVVEVFLPSGTQPAGGWPVAIFGHGFTDSLYGAPWTVASTLAHYGIATVAISVVGHSGGPLSTLTVAQTGKSPVLVPAGGRGIDQDGNGTIDSTEGVSAVGALSIVSSRDGLRQTVVDLMQLVRQIQVGVDVDGDAVADLDAQRIYYAGQSFGGIYGTIFLGVEDAVKAGVPNVPGGSITEVARLGAFRGLTGLALLSRQPQLLNLPPTPDLPVPYNFDENMPLRNQPARVTQVPGATAIQQVLERNEWVQQSGNPVSYAAAMSRKPYKGHAAKPVILQFAKGDGTVPNPSTTAIVRAGRLADRTLYFRNDLAYAATGGAIPKNPHTFLTNIGIPAAVPFAVAAQTQIAVFFQSQGTVVIDPDGAGPMFEMPIVGPLPEELNFLP
jgi:hypothetical protein